MQITADKHVHLLSGRKVRFIDRLNASNAAQPNATQTQLENLDRERFGDENNPQVVEGKPWCERGDSNPHGFTRQILSLVRLPIPPLSRLEISYSICGVSCNF